MLHTQHGKDYLTVCYYNENNNDSIIFWISPFVNSKAGGSICHVVYPMSKAGGLQILCCQGIAVSDYSFTLDAWVLKPSDFCNVGVNCDQSKVIFEKSL